MTEDRWQEIFHLTLHLNLETRTRHPTAETRDLKVSQSPQPILRFPVSP